MRRRKSRIDPNLQPNVERQLKALGKIIGDCCPAHVGFALLMFDFGPRGFLNYISNAHRQDMLKALKEMVEQLELSMPDPSQPTN